MKNSQLVDIIGTLNKKEVRELKKWLCSPAHNHRQDTLLLFEYLLKAEQLDADKYLEKERIFKKIFPKTPYDDARLRQSMHFLLKTIEEYLAFTALKTDDVKAQLELAKTYRHKKLDKPYEKVKKNIDKLREQFVVQDDQYYFLQYQILQEEYDYLTKKKASSTDLQQISNNLEVSFIIAKLRLACYMLNHQSIYKKEYDFGLTEAILLFVEKSDLLDIPAIKIYYYFYKALYDPDNEESYYTFRDSIFNHSKVLQHAEMRDIYLLGINYCITTKLNQLKKHFYSEVFELYRNGIENKVLFTDGGQLSEQTFKNVVSIGTIVRQFQWVEQFMDTHEVYLPLANREQLVTFTKGKFHFEKGEYKKARNYLLSSNPNDVLLNLNAKSMLIRIYYQQDEFQLLDSFLESTKAYINRKKNLVSQYRVPYLNLIKYTKKLIKVNPYDKSAKEKLRQEIDLAHPLIAKEWFLKQVERL